MPTDAVGVLLGHRQAVTTAQLLARLRRAGLAQDQVFKLGPLLGSRPVHLWRLTADGRAFVASRGPAPAMGQTPYGEPKRRRDPGRQRDVPLLAACYRLLARVATGLDRPVHVAAWEHPWIRVIVPTGRGRARRARLPAAAVLQRRQTDAEQPLRLLLLPDVGTAPLASYRLTLQALFELRRTAYMEEEYEPVLIVGIAIPPRSSSERMEAWQSLLREVARRADDRPLRASVLNLDGSLTNRRDNDRCPPDQGAEVFALIARHPLLTRQQLASLLHTSTPRIARLTAGLMGRAWLRPVTIDNLRPGSDASTHAQVPRLGLVELTAAGQQEAARRLLVPAGLAQRRHGVTVADTSGRGVLRHLQHTLGANAFFVSLAAAATQVTSRGGDEALVDWRSAAACARGRFRPDGYGCYRRGLWRFGFFLEYDRGTERPDQYAAKLAAYYRYRDCGAAAREYTGFPTVLVVTTREAAELRFAHEAYVACERHGGKPLSLLLTRTDVLEATRGGVLGPIWRTPGLYGEQPTRAYWLPREPPHGSLPIARQHVSRGDR